MNQIPKLSIFFDLGVKPMKDVILHHPNWFVRCGNVTIEQMENIREIKEQQEKEKEYIEEWNRTHDGSTVISGCQHQYIEAIPERLNTEQAHRVLETLRERIEASYD